VISRPPQSARMFPFVVLGLLALVRLCQPLLLRFAVEHDSLGASSDKVDGSQDTSPRTLTCLCLQRGTWCLRLTLAAATAMALRATSGRRGPLLQTSHSNTPPAPPPAPTARVARSAKGERDRSPLASGCWLGGRTRVRHASKVSQRCDAAAASTFDPRGSTWGAGGERKQLACGSCLGRVTGQLVVAQCPTLGSCERPTGRSPRDCPGRLVRHITFLATQNEISASTSAFIAAFGSRCVAV
jgi:hypothetical protein